MHMRTYTHTQTLHTLAVDNQNYKVVNFDLAISVTDFFNGNQIHLLLNHIKFFFTLILLHFHDCADKNHTAESKTVTYEIK